MANVTITLDDALLAAARGEAERAGKSLSAYLAALVAAERDRLRAERMAGLDAFLDIASRVKVSGAAEKFNRDEIHDEAFSRYERGDLRFGPARSVQTGALPRVAESGGGSEFADDKPASGGRGAKRRGKKAEDRR
jgi:hypothetical protein